MIRGGIFGISLSGKTTLAKHLSAGYFHKGNLNSLVLDPHEENYGEHAEVLGIENEDLFWQKVWEAEQPYLVIVDEASATLRREREMVPVFTRLRHKKHRLLVLGHKSTDLLPVMREQLDTLYLFRQSATSADEWADLFGEKELISCSNLSQYEYIFCQLYGKPKKCLLKPYDGAASTY